MAWFIWVEIAKSLLLRIKSKGGSSYWRANRNFCSLFQVYINDESKSAEKMYESKLEQFIDSIYTAQPINEEEGGDREDDESTSANNTTASTTNTSVEYTTDPIPLIIHDAIDEASNDLIAVYENVLPGLFDNADCDDESEDDAGPPPEKKTRKKKGGQ